MSRTAVGAVGDAPQTNPSRPSTNLVLGPDGVCRWVYEFNLYRNPTILVLIWKIFGGIFLGMFVLILLLQSGEGLKQTFTGLAPVFLGLFGGMLILTTIAYYLYALLMGGKYCVLFEMDDQGISHIQMPRQYSKAQVLSHLLVLSGALKGNAGRVGQGLLVGSKQATYTKFKSVRSVRPDRRHHVIKVNSADLVHNQVYAEDADFDYVLNFILQHVRTKP